jgi:hypothetical protein
MMHPMRGSDDEKLDALLRAFGAACPTPEPGVNFMPQLWQRIESHQRTTFSFRRMAQAWVTAAVALSIAAGVYMAVPRSSPLLYSQTYIEALADAETLDTPDIVDPVRLDLTDTSR